MAAEELFLRRALVFGAALVYWAGVVIQARRVRRRIGRSPNLRPRGRREKLLWAGWLLVILGWLIQPVIVGNASLPPRLGVRSSLLYPSGLILGLALTVTGYAGTLWSYAAMGSAWRIGINRHERNQIVTHGPYRFVRHPIYLFQVVMLFGAAFLLPTLPSLFILFLHFLCVMIKATDEEDYLVSVNGQEYRDYLSRTGRLLPKLTQPISASK